MTAADFAASMVTSTITRVSQTADWITSVTPEPSTIALLSPLVAAALSSAYAENFKPATFPQRAWQEKGAWALGTP